MSCSLCQNPKTIKSCESCDKVVCKNCVRYLEKENFQFHPKPPKFFQYKTFCVDCYEEKVAPELTKYAETLEAAKEVLFLSKNYRGLVPVIRKAKEPSSVKRQTDRKEAILHLAFWAAFDGYNAIIKGETISKQIRNYGYQHNIWTATGLPVFIDVKKFERLNED